MGDLRIELQAPALADATSYNKIKVCHQLSLPQQDDYQNI